jgi:membrane-associated phospholipid phosphatase
MEPLALLLLASLAAAACAAGVSRWASRTRPGQRAAQQAGEALAERSVNPRLDPSTATGFALTLALVAIGALGALFTVLALLVRSQNGLVAFDRSVADWGREHATAVSGHVLDAISFVGQPVSISVLAAVFAITATIRTRSRWIVPFVLIVLAGNGLLTTLMKGLDDRVRPTVNPIAAHLGPSFPSGHSSWTAAFLAAAALVLSHGRGRGSRAVLAGTAVGIAVAMATTRVLLGVHWLSDVIAGLALGWAWFAACAIAFGGRLLRSGRSRRRSAWRARPGPSGRWRLVGQQ